MACKELRNKDGKIIGMLDSTGQKSKLFEAIMAHPTIKTTEDAAAVYKNIYSEKMKPFLDEIRFQAQEIATETAKQLVNQLEKTGLASQVHFMSTEQIQAKLRELGEENIQRTARGFVHNGEVYLNEGAISLDTPIHEFSHIYNNILKTSRPEVYNRGIELVNQELEKGSKFDLPSFRIFNYLVPTSELIKIREFDRQKPLRGDEYYNTLKEDIRKNGIREPITVIVQDGKMIINEGNHRLRAAIELGITEIPVTRSVYKMTKQQLEKAANKINLEMYGFTEAQRFNRENVLYNTDIISPIQDVIDYVKQTQSNLQGERLAEEILAELTGRRGLELLEQHKDSKSGIIEWIKQAFEYIKDLLGLSNMSDEQIMNLTLQEYADAMATDLLSGEFLERGTETSDIRFQLIGEKGAQNIVKYKNNLDKAKELEKKGLSLSDISDQTGWYKYKGDWKMFSNEALEQFKLKDDIQDNKLYKLKEVLDSNIIFEMYPSLADIAVSFEKVAKDAATVISEFNPSSGSINISYREGGERKATLAHELSHAIQQEEGLPTGGSPDGYLLIALAEQGIVDKNTDLSSLTLEQLRDATSNSDNPIRKNIHSLINDILNNPNKAEESKYFLYRSIMGEIDAHAVQEAYSEFRKGDLGYTYEEILENQLTFLSRAGIKENEILVRRDPAESLSIKNRANEVVFNSYKEALNTNSNEIETGFETPTGEFIPFQKSRPTMDSKTFEGFINSSIKQGTLKETKKIVDGEAYFEAGGTTPSQVRINTMSVQDEALLSLGWKNFQKTKHGFKFQQPEETKSFSKEQENVLRGVSDELKSTFTNQTLRNEAELPTEKDLQGALKDFLNSIGVNLMSIDDYISKYKLKNGAEPSAKALADISNQIIAFKDGEITLERLSEEVAHFIVEGWNQAEIENILRNIHQTPEYQQFVQHYTELYSKKYKGDELDQAVRREVLGKVLHKAMMENFNSNYAQSETHKTIIQRLSELFNRFIDKVRSLFKPSHSEQIRQFTDQVVENLYRGELQSHINTSNFKNNPFVLYQSGEESSTLKGMKMEVLQALKMLRANITTLRGTVAQSQADKVRIDRKVLELETLEDELINRQTVNELASIADSQVKHIKRIINQDIAEANVSFTSEVNSVYEMLKGNFLPTLVRIAHNLKTDKTKYNPKEWNNIISEVDRVTNDIQQLDPIINQLHDKNMDSIVNRIMLKFNLGSWYKDHIREIAETAYKDTSYFHRHFGQLNNSRNPYLGTLSEVIERTFFGVGQEAHFELKKWQQRFEELGMTPEDQKAIIDGSHYVAPQNEGLKAEVSDRIDAMVRLQVLGDTTTTIDEVLRLMERNELPELTPQQKADHNRISSDLKRQLKEQPWLNNYYQEREERWNKLNISKNTQSVISAYSQDRFNILRNTRDENGVNDLTKLSRSEREALESIKKRRKNDKSFYNDDGTLKKGIGIATDVNEINFPKYDFLTKEKDSNKALYFTDPYSKLVYYINDSSMTENSDARLAIDLNKLDIDFANQLNNGKIEFKDIPPLFRKGLDEIQAKYENLVYERRGIDKNTATPQQQEEVRRIAESEAYEESLEFVDLNSNLNFSKEFWDSMDSSNSLEEVARRDISKIEDKDQRIEATAIWRNLKKLSAQRSALMRQYKRSNQPHEIDANNMSISSKERIIQLDEDILTERNKLRNLLPESQSTSEASPFEAVRELNRSYWEAVEGMEGMEEINFILNNTSEKGKHKIYDFLTALRRNSYTRSQQRFVNEFEENPDNEGEKVEVAYARQQVASYYKRFAPIELSEVVDSRDNYRNINEYLSKVRNTNTIVIEPHFTFLEETASNKRNPDFDNDYKGEWLAKKGNINYTSYKVEDGKVVFKKDNNGNILLDSEGVPIPETTNEVVNFESQKYIDLFGTDGNKNPRLKQIYDTFLEQKQASFDNYGINDYSNLYLLPQIYQTGIDRALETMKRASVKGVRQGLEQAFMHREDDVAYGEKVQDFARDINIIPKYYVNKLKNQEELSKEIEWSQALMYQQSVLYKHRKNNIAEVLAIRNALDNVNRSASRGKEARVTMDMFDNYVDYAFYGQKETVEFKVPIFGQQVDVTKSARMLLDYVKFRNMGFNTIVSVTSWLTSEVSLQIEKAVGEIMNKDASNMATKKFAEMLTEALKDTGQLHAKSELINQMEFFGVYDPLQRLKNPTFKWMPRMLQQLGWGVQQAADFPISPRGMLSVMMDNRIVNGKIVNFNTFKLENPKLTKKQAREKWREYSNLNMQRFLDLSDRNVKFKDEIKKHLKEEVVGDLDTYLELTMERLSANVKRVVSQLNQLIPESQKVAAQRHFAMNYLMTHKSWLSIVLSNRTKNGHINTSTGLWEEGTYRTFFKFAETAIKEMTSKGFIQGLKDAWNGADIADDVIGKDGEVIPQNDLNIPKQMLLATRRRNMHRMLIDLGWVLGLAGLSFGLMALTDNDEDDNYALQMTSYISLRLLNQVATMGTAIPNQMVETLESPFVGLSVVMDMMKMPVNIFNSNQVQQGKFKGDSVRMAELQKTVPGLKTYGDLKSLEHSANSYYSFNRNNILWSPAAMFDLMYNSQKE